MALNPFHPDALDPFGKAVTAIKKGDVPGHVFHGNQYESGSGDGRENLHPWNRARNVATEASAVRANEREGTPSADAHLGMAQEHIAIGNNLLKNVEGAKADPEYPKMHQLVKDKFRGLELAAQAHFAAAKAHTDAMPFSGHEAGGDWEKSSLDHAEALSHAAAVMTEEAATVGQRANDRVKYNGRELR
jgi:hypothetical protein